MSTCSEVGSPKFDSWTGQRCYNSQKCVFMGSYTYPSLTLVPVGDKEDTVYLKIKFKNNFWGGSERWAPAQKWTVPSLIPELVRGVKFQKCVFMGSYPYPSLTLVPVGDKDDTGHSQILYDVIKTCLLQINISDQFKNQTWGCPLLSRCSPLWAIWKLN